MTNSTSRPRRITMWNCIPFVALLLSLSADAWIPTHTIRTWSPTVVRTPSSSSSLCATIENDNMYDTSSEESSNSQQQPPRRTRRIDDILEEYEATGDAGLTISILESTLKKEQEKSSTLAVQLAHAEHVISEQQRRLKEERAFLQEKAQALAATQKRLQELEQQMKSGVQGQAPQQQQAQQQAPPKQPQTQQAPWQQPPILTNERQYPLITNWSINPNTGEVTGSVSCHPSIPDGTTIVTSGLNAESFRMAGDSFVYEANKPATVVTTRSGTMYQLGVKKKIRRRQAPPKTAAQQQVLQQEQDRKRRQLQEQINPNISLDVPLTGESISNGRGTKYLLAGTPKRKPSGRSEIVLAYKCDDTLRVCDSVTPYVIKLSTNKDKLRREFENYKLLQENTSGGGGFLGSALSLFDQQNGSKEDPFVGCYDFLPVCEGSIKYAQHSALVMEKGHEDLRDYEYSLQQSMEDNSEYMQHQQQQQQQPMDPTVVMSALLVAAQCIDVLHSRARLVWTDLKAENLIFMEPQETLEDGSLAKVVPIKGIDLESAISHRGNPLDYTPEACPPEFAKFHLAGKAYDFVLDYSYDVWSFGMLAYELATGAAYFKHKTPKEIMDSLGNPNFVPPLSNSGNGNEDDLQQQVDPLLVDLIRACLQVDPRSRISVRNILRHRYFQQQTYNGSGSGGDNNYESDSGTFW